MLRVSLVRQVNIDQGSDGVHRETVLCYIEKVALAREIFRIPFEDIKARVIEILPGKIGILGRWVAKDEGRTEKLALRAVGIRGWKGHINVRRRLFGMEAICPLERTDV